MSNEKVTVMEKLIADCRRAHQARIPLIMVDTEEIELMDRLAQESRLVDFFTPRAHKVDQRYIPYYKYLGEDPMPLDASENFTYSIQKLQELIARNRNMEYEGAGMEHENAGIGNQPQSVMAVLHLSHSSWKRGGEGKKSTDLNETMVNFLRSYVQAYTRCRDLGSVLKNSRVLLYGDPSLLPQDLEPFTEILTVEYPQIWELEQIIRRIAAENGKPFTSGGAPKKLAEQMTGFGLIRAERFVQKLLWIDGKNGKPMLFDPEECEDLLLEEKAGAVRSAGGLLQLHREKRSPEKAGKNRLGGMADYTKWVTGRKQQMIDYADYASTRGVPALKGVLLCGVPGCGKSEAAKILHQDWGIPMLRLDIDQLMGGLVGDSERNMRRALALAEAMSPVILWIDEIDKGFAGASSGSHDGGTFKRMFGRLLTWMQENTKPCFIFATANDISQLPPEFFRSGRFDALFSVYMPTHEECKQIFAEQMRRADKLRRDQLKAKGGDPKTLRPLFDNSDQGCFTDDALESIMTLVMRGRERKAAVKPEDLTELRFISGADIRKIVTTALAKLPPEGLRKPVTRAEWLSAVRSVVEDPALTTQGSSSSNLDEIAACYVRLMRKNFAPVSAQNQQLFLRENYTCTTSGSEVRAEYTGELDAKWPAYDRALFLALKGRIQNIASLLETNALRRVSM